MTIILPIFAAQSTGVLTSDEKSMELNVVDIFKIANRLGLCYMVEEFDGWESIESFTATGKAHGEFIICEREMLKSVIRFRKTGTKSHIYNADVELQFIKTIIRLSYDLEYPAMSKHRYEVLSKKMTELGCIIGGIIEAVKNGNWK